MLPNADGGLTLDATASVTTLRNYYSTINHEKKKKKKMKTRQSIGSPKEWQAYIANLVLAIQKVKQDIYKEYQRSFPNSTKLLVMKEEYEFLNKAMVRCNNDYKKVQERWRIATEEYRAIKDEVEDILRAKKNSANKNK
ncbi:MAG: hypothetical protein NTV22_03535 [bacterium]|nr:hypothetical protein [bacterium]